MGAPQGGTLGLMNPLSRRSSSRAFSSFSSVKAIRYGAFEMGVVSGAKPMKNSIFRFEGIEGSLSEKKLSEKKETLELPKSSQDLEPLCE